MWPLQEQSADKKDAQDAPALVLQVHEGLKPGLVGPCRKPDVDFVVGVCILCQIGLPEHLLA